MQYFFKLKTGDKEYPLMVIDDTHNFDVITSIITNTALETGIIESRLDPFTFEQISKLEFHILTNFNFIEVTFQHKEQVSELQHLLNQFINTNNGFELIKAKRILDNILKTL